MTGNDVPATSSSEELQQSQLENTSQNNIHTRQANHPTTESDYSRSRSTRVFRFDITSTSRETIILH